MHALKTWIGTNLGGLVISRLPSFTTPSGILSVWEHLTRFLQTQNRLRWTSCLHAAVIPTMPSKVQVFETKSHILETVFYFFYIPNKFTKFTPFCWRRFCTLSWDKPTMSTKIRLRLYKSSKRILLSTYKI